MIKLTEKEQKYIGIEDVYVEERIRYDQLIKVLKETQTQARDWKRRKKLAGIEDTSGLSDKELRDIHNRVERNLGFDV